MDVPMLFVGGLSSTERRYFCCCCCCCCCCRYYYPRHEIHTKVFSKYRLNSNRYRMLRIGPLISQAEKSLSRTDKYDA